MTALLYRLVLVLLAFSAHKQVSQLAPKFHLFTQPVYFSCEVDFPVTRGSWMYVSVMQAGHCSGVKFGPMDKRQIIGCAEQTALVKDAIVRINVNIDSCFDERIREIYREGWR